MPTWLSVVLEIVKITIPALIAFFTAYFILREFLTKQHQMKLVELRQGQQKKTLPLRFQAYERLSLFCERISIPNLVLRLRTENSNAAALHIALLMAIQQEFEHNISQQVYVSDQLWQIIKMARENNMSLINMVAERVDPKAPSSELATALMKEDEGKSSTDKALFAIKKEAGMLM